MDDHSNQKKKSLQQRFWRRISDSTKVPRRWWLLEDRITFTSAEEWQRQHDEVSSTIRRVMISIVAYSLFCILILGAPDVNLIANNASIKVPFADTDVSYSGFLVFGPLILAGMFIYLQIFLGHLNKLVPPSNKEPLPFIFNMSSYFPKMLSNFLLYWLAPCVLLVFAWKAAPRDEGVYLLYFAELSGACIVFLQIRRFLWSTSPTLVQRVRYGALWLIFSLLAGLMVYTPALPLYRSLSLFKADLNGLDLRNANLKGAYLLEAGLNSAILINANLENANLNGAILNDADLSGADMRGAILSSANMTSTILSSANLSKAKLDFAILKNAELLDVNLTNAILDSADLSNSDLNFTNFEGANLGGTNIRSSNLSNVNLSNTYLNAADLAYANLENANLSNADLTFTILRNAKLRGANLSRAKLMSADLSGADLSGVTVTQDQLNDACGSKNTKLPAGLKIKFCARFLKK